MFITVDTVVMYVCMPPIRLVLSSSRVPGVIKQ